MSADAVLIRPQGESAVAPPSPRVSPLFALLDRLSLPIAALGAASLVAVALLGFGKQRGTWLSDFYWYYAGGRCFWIGSNMYDPACFAHELVRLNGEHAFAGLAYPPYIGPVALAVSAVPGPWSGVALVLANIAATGALAGIGIEVARRVSPADRGKMLGFGVLVGIALGNPGTWGAIWMGQLTPLVALSLWAAFLLIARGREGAAGALMAVAALKPQLSLFVFLWLLLHGRVKVLAVAASIAAVMSAYVVAVMGLRPALTGWLRALAVYQDYPANRLGDAAVDGVPSVLAVLGASMSLAVAAGIGMVAVVALRFLGRTPPFAPLTLAALVALQMIVYSHPLDMVLLVPAFALLWPQASWKSWQMLLFLAAVAIFCVPRPASLVGLMGPVAAHFRTTLLIVFCALFVRQMLKGGERIGPVIPAGNPLPAV